MKACETTLFVVDDDDIAVMAVERAAASLDLSVPILRARDGEEALEMLREKPSEGVPSPFIILLDINMPRMTGIEFLTQLRADPQLAGAVAFVMTTSDAPRDVSAAYAHHVAGYIVKSSGQETLRRLLRMLEEYEHIVTPFPDTRALSDFQPDPRHNPG